MEKIMVVDDSKAIRMQVKTLLKNAGYEVYESSTGNDALIEVDHNKDIALFIVDYNMPGISGLDMIEKLRLINPYEKVPVLMMTTESAADLRRRGRELGVLAWVVKPVSPKDLLVVIEKCLKNAVRVAGPKFRV